MIEFNLDESKLVLHIHPTGPLRKEDFDNLAETVDPIIEREGNLNGLIIETAGFPGWENFGSAIRHFRFVHDHHKKIEKVAIVTDSKLGEAAEHIASHFVSAEIRHFPIGEINEAKGWIASIEKSD
ncbi:MAG: STAS/SEC14 domain-containing protein [Candidatus Omnitrophica bacterium]|nr:STAS/SEC14 domain-containing protein [Candidatus Omnitrophota bacterium]MCA9431663.1 STAS/SEC14 domain-containing protein [Candidatus Omnitrophota bacterium]MCB9768062.1 STAS/SEC14 domain-containing protein [Candidatus Omnitrophota bacterium]